MLYLSGPVHWTPEWKSLVWNGLLATGGWLVLDVNPIHDAIYSDLGNPPLLAFVPGYAADQIGMANVLAGHVVRIGSPAHYPALVAELGRRFLPFSIAAADFALNSLRPDSWIVTLINDSGIDKAPRTPAVVTQGPETISVVPNGKKIKNAFVLRSASAPAWTADGLQVAVAAGDTAVIRIDLQ